eukprot:jgi/Botrbrau1/13741/Bobra.0356s0017.1
MPQGDLSSGVLILLLLGVLPASQAGNCLFPGLQVGNGTVDTLWGPATDPATIGKWFEANFFHAQLDETFPTNPLLRISPRFEFYQAKLCAPEDVHKCMHYGNSSNGLPKDIQGVWWLRGIDFPGEVLHSTAGDWDPVQRKLHITNYAERIWGFESTSSVIEDCWFAFSGASHMNFFTTFEATLDIYMNEDYTATQLVPGFTWPFTLGQNFQTPVWVFNWTSQLLPDNRWLRRTSTFGIPTPSGNYIWHQIVTGDGKPGRWYNEWVQSRAGKPFAYLVKVYP